MWAATAAGILYFKAARWHTVGPESGFPGGYTRQLYVDRDGALWATTNTAVVLRKPGENTFTDSGIRANFGSVAQASDGTFWLADQRLGLRPLAPAETGAADPWIAHTSARGILFDREGALWSNTNNGIVRVRYAGRREPPGALVETFDSRDGLSGQRVLSYLEDREGNIWFGTSGGLDRFRSAALVQVAMPPRSEYFSLAAGESGAMLIGTDNAGLFLSAQAMGPVKNSPNEILSLYRDTDGVLWLGGNGALWRSDADHFTRVPLPEGIEAPISDIQAITRDRDGGLWVSIASTGLYRLSKGSWTAFGDQPALPKLTPMTAVADGSGTVWFGYTGGLVSSFDGKVVRNFSAADGLRVGNVLTIDAHAKNIWVGGELGLARFDNGHFHSVNARGDRSLASVSGIVETGDGDLWVNESDGVMHITAGELSHSSTDPAYQVENETFNFQDGLPGNLQGVRPLPTAAQGSDGRLWFVTSTGVAWLDPARIPRNPVVPTVWIQSITADGRRYPAQYGDPIQLPVRTSSLEIEYTGLSLQVPERVQFRYQLQGEDSDWQAAGNRRVAFYTNLRPGRYQFKVIASNNDRIWNERGATIAVTIPPTFVQTNWFLALCGLGVAAILCLLYLFRLRQMTARVRDRLEERLAERERIARELHDTLLQGMQGLILRFHGLSQRPGIDKPERAAMKDALDSAQRALVDARDRVTGLRESTLTTPGLLESLTRVGESLAQDHACTLQATIQGEAVRLHPVVYDEVQCIGAEALANAFNHAQANRVELDIHFDRAELRLRIRDDGRGFELATLEAANRQGHWGLTGMRERAHKIRGRIDIWSRPGAGTEIDLRIPAAMAYHDPVPRSSLSWLQRFFQQREHL